MKEILYVHKHLGFWYALYYFFYKINLGILLIPFFKSKKENNKIAIDKIYTTLIFQHLQHETIQGVKFYKQPIPFSKAIAWLRPNSSDAKVYQQVLLHKEYKSVIEIYNQFWWLNQQILQHINSLPIAFFCFCKLFDF